MDDKHLLRLLLFTYTCSYCMGFPRGAMVKNPLANAEDVRNLGPWVWKISLDSPWQPTPVFLPGKFHDRGAWWVVESDMTEHTHTHTLINFVLLKL